MKKNKPLLLANRALADKISELYNKLEEVKDEILFCNYGNAKHKINDIIYFTPLEITIIEEEIEDE